MKTAKKILILAFILILIFASVSPAANIKKRRRRDFSDKSKSYSVDRPAVNVINNFAFNLADIIGKNSDKYFFSPYSILSALNIAYAGAKNGTAKEFEEALGFTPEINSQLEKLTEHFRNGILTANRAWIDESIKLKLSGDCYRQLDFNKSNSVRIINDWVREKTKGKIQNVINALHPDMKMILTNAVYFRGKWNNPFGKEYTSKEKFFVSPENFVMTDMMRQNHDFLFAEVDGSKIIKLPYTDDYFSFIAVLPPEGRELKLNAEIFTSWLDSMKMYDVDLRLPKFKTEVSYELTPVLNSMGVNLAFTDSADFSGITDNAILKIDSLCHKTFIDVDEERTEAAAYTGAFMLGFTSPPPNPKAEFHADRPFLYFIFHEKTGTILFMGRQTFDNNI